MLKFFFWSLLCINAVLLAYGQGYLGNFSGNEREPARMKNQANASRLTLVSAAQASAALARASVAQAVVAAPQPERAACVEAGDFTLPEARRFEAQLAALELGERQTRHSVAEQEITSHIVYIQPQGSKEAAERQTIELRNMGVTNYFIIADNSPLKWGISLGVFKSAAAAQSLLAALNKKGVRGARVGARGYNKIAYRFQDLDAGTRAKLDDIKQGFPGQQLRSCS